MFDSRQKSLIEKKTTSGSSNAFLGAAMTKAAETKSGNGALKYSSTTDEFVNQFGSISGYKAPRKYADISNDMATLWKINPLTTICFTIYLRIITRITQFVNGDKTEVSQKGPGLKHESIMRMLWICINHPKSFWKNINLFVVAGAWKDIFKMLQYDIMAHGWKDRQLPWLELGKFILAGLENPNTSELVKKYLPQIESNNRCTTLESQANNIIGKWICSLIYGGKTMEDDYKNYRLYRKLKASGKAHQWQQLISRQRHDLVNFSTIAGRALSQMVSSKYLKNHGLVEKYSKWIASKPVAKFTGYVHELGALINNNLQKYQEDTINAQYRQLLEKVGTLKDNGFIAVKDTSSSMNSPAIGTKLPSYTIAKAISIFLANILEGAFKNHYIDFSSKAILRPVKGSNFVEHWRTEIRVDSANTNFQAVAELLVEVRRSGVNESDFPAGIICISDGEFDYSGRVNMTNVKAFREALRFGGFSSEFVKNFKFCFWDIRNTFYGSRFNNTKFETRSLDDNVFYFGGFDPSVISFLIGVEGEAQKFAAPKNAKEVFENAMAQELLQLVEV